MAHSVQYTTIKIPTLASLNGVARGAVFGSTGSLLVNGFTSYLVTPLTGAIAYGVSRFVQNLLANRYKTTDLVTIALGNLVGSAVATGVAQYAFRASIIAVGGPLNFFTAALICTAISTALDHVSKINF